MPLQQNLGQILAVFLRIQIFLVDEQLCQFAVKNAVVADAVKLGELFVTDIMVDIPGQKYTVFQIIPVEYSVFLIISLIIADHTVVLLPANL